MEIMILLVVVFFCPLLAIWRTPQGNSYTHTIFTKQTRDAIMCFCCCFHFIFVVWTNSKFQAHGCNKNEQRLVTTQLFIDLFQDCEIGIFVIGTQSATLASMLWHCLFDAWAPKYCWCGAVIFIKQLSFTDRIYAMKRQQWTKNTHTHCLCATNGYWKCSSREERVLTMWYNALYDRPSRFVRSVMSIILFDDFVKRKLSCLLNVIYLF